MRYGLNWDRLGRGRGWELVLFWRGWFYYYAIRLRTRPRELGPWRLHSWRSCIQCDPRIRAWCPRHQWIRDDVKA